MLTFHRGGIHPNDKKITKPSKAKISQNKAKIKREKNFKKEK